MGLHIAKWPEYYKDFKRSLSNPKQTQINTLKRILEENKNTKTGLRYDFKEMLNSKNPISEFRKKVPIIEYENIEREVEQVKKGHWRDFMPGKPCWFFTSSGRKNKFIPRRLETVEEDLDRKMAVWIRKNFFRMPFMFFSKVLYFATPARLGVVQDGKTPHGNISGYLVSRTSWPANRLLILSAIDYAVKSPNERMQVYAKKAMMAGRITQFSFTYPDEAFSFMDYLDDNWPKLISELKSEGVKGLKAVTRLKLMGLGEKFDAKIFFKHVKVINCIQYGQKGKLDALKQIMPNAKDTNPGVLASEADITLKFDFSSSHDGLPTITSNFFEFFEIDESGTANPNKKTLLVSELKKNKEYGIIVTTRDGLMRYYMRDKVVPVKKMGKLWQLKFVGRDKVLDVAGEHCPYEKLEEGIKNALDLKKVDYNSFVLTPHYGKAGKNLTRYRILLEPKEPLSEKKLVEVLKKVHKNFMGMITYNKSITKFIPKRFDTPLITEVSQGSFHKYYMSKIKGQRKEVHVLDDASFANELKIGKTYDISGKEFKL